MAMIKCPDCGARISQASHSCIKCGRPGPFEAAKKKGVGCGTVLLVLIGLFVFLAYMGGKMSSPIEQATSQSAISTGKEQSAPVAAKEQAIKNKDVEDVELTKIKMIRICEGHVSKKLKDADSAKYRNVFVSSKNIVCGEVNSKNSFGGYAGFQFFICGGEDATFLEHEVASGQFKKPWDTFCK